MDPHLQAQLLLAGAMSGDLNGMANSIARMERGTLNDTKNRLRMARRLPPEAQKALESFGFIFPVAPGEKPSREQLLTGRLPQDFDDPLKDDPVLMTVDAPPGWKFAPTGDNGYWSNLVDPQGRVRGSQFYKGAFYDRNANFSLSRRYNLSSEYNEAVYSVKRDERGDMQYVRWRVKDADGTVLWTGEWLTQATADRLEEYTPDYTGYAHAKERADALGITWLRENYPQYEDFKAYW